MDLTKKAKLKGSPSLDAFKHWHKNALSVKNYALDGDLMLISKRPPRIIALLDYKVLGERIQPTFSEVIAYNHLTSVGIPVYIVQSDRNFWQFSVLRFNGGDFRPFPPVSNLTIIFQDQPPDAYLKWEQNLRQEASND